ncbi:MAG: class I SAM-dependent methyltransferase [Acidimicrobiales bacterium]
MTTTQPEEENVDALIRRLRARVQERRKAGAYPPDLEDKLDEHFDRVAAHLQRPYDHERLHAALGNLEQNMGFSPARIEVNSSVPGGGAIHKAAAKVVGRQTAGILAQSQTFAEAVRDALREVVAAIEHPHGHDHVSLMGQIDALFDRVSAFERAPVESGAAVADLRRRVADLEADALKRGFRPWFSAEDFEEAFRGSADELRGRYADLAGRFEGMLSVVDIGCGRGEFIDILRANGLEASGVEIDPDLVEAGRARGLDIVEGDAIGWLRLQDDESVDALSLIQVIEHLSPQEVVDFVALSATKLKKGGLLVVETVNPQSLYVYAHSFYLDPTHSQPVHPSYLSFLFQQIGFAIVEIDWRSPTPASDVLDDVADDAPGASVHNANTKRLNQLLFGSQDYAVIARR